MFGEHQKWRKYQCRLNAQIATSRFIPGLKRSGKKLRRKEQEQGPVLAIPVTVAPVTGLALFF